MARVYLETSFVSYLTALHIAIATVHQIDYLLTWNCKHIANQEILPRIANLCADLGLMLPIICTPEELLGVTNDH